MGLVRRIAYNTLVATGGRLIGVVLSLISFGLIARYLGQEGFGSYALVLAFLSIFNIMADLGLYSLLTREISRPGVDERKIVSNIFTLRLFALVAFFILASALVWLLPYPRIVKIGVALGSLSFLFLSAAQVLMGVFQKQLRTDKVALSEIIGRATQLILLIVFVQLKLGFLAVLSTLVVGSLFIFILNFIFVRQHLAIGLAFDFIYWKKIIRLTLPIALAIVFTLVYFKIDSLFLSLSAVNRSSGNVLSDVGLYAIAYKVLEGLIFFPAMFVGLIMPLLSKFALTNIPDFKKIFQKTLDLLLIFLVPLVVALIILAEPVVVLIGGSHFIGAASILRILSLAVGLIFLGNLLGNSAIALNKQKSAAWIYFTGMIFNVITNLIFIPRYSYMGAASTTVLTELLVTLSLFYLIRKTVDYRPSFRMLFKILPAVMVMVILIKLLYPLNIIILGFSSLIAYLAFLYLIGGIKKEELKLLFQR